MLSLDVLAGLVSHALEEMPQLVWEMKLIVDINRSGGLDQCTSTMRPRRLSTLDEAPFIVLRRWQTYSPSEHPRQLSQRARGSRLTKDSYHSIQLAKQQPPVALGYRGPLQRADGVEG